MNVKLTMQVSIAKTKPTKQIGEFIHKMKSIVDQKYGLQIKDHVITKVKTKPNQYIVRFCILKEAEAEEAKENDFGLFSDIIQDFETERNKEYGDTIAALHAFDITT